MLVETFNQTICEFNIPGGKVPSGVQEVQSTVRPIPIVLLLGDSHWLCSSRPCSVREPDANAFNTFFGDSMSWLCVALDPQYSALRQDTNSQTSHARFEH